MYKAPLTATVFKTFSSGYHHLASLNIDRPEEPFVYVDARGVKLVTNVMDELESSPDGVFALSMAQDGWVEMLALYEAS
ncbi:MAG TPA: hypothetical protein VNJ01_12935 [Bacteriovoracaceae bacterium]|nr:hypothetical protein [Bacteriovoracaceae bacterium]